MSDLSDRIIASRRWMTEGWSNSPSHSDEEGGCGVTGFICNIPVRGQHIYTPSVQMHNRGNGKGGGIAAVGFEADQLGVSPEVLARDYMLHLALLDPKALARIEADFITPMFDIDHAERMDHVDKFTDVQGLEVCPPEVQRYFVRPKPGILKQFAEERGLCGLSDEDIEEEFIYQNSFQLNSKYYASLGDKAAFVLSHGRNMLILKIVGYAEQIVEYYKLQDFKAHAWIAHQRYPTRGRVWHPGGAHPFCGMNEALVHNGDFANYYSVTEYLEQHNIKPLFLTDTEVSIQVFDLWSRVYKYPLEYVIEGLAPTVERDFDMLPEEKQRVYRRIQASHIHGSPDGPWFFIIARNDVRNGEFQLLGITDTAMLRPQVFALQRSGDVEIGLICSEKQAIDATLASLSKEDNRFRPIADEYWNARGGSYTDGGAFIFRVSKNGEGCHLTCSDKFGNLKQLSPICPLDAGPHIADYVLAASLLFDESGRAIFEAGSDAAQETGLGSLLGMCFRMAATALTDRERAAVINGLTLLMDRRYSCGKNNRASILQILNQCLADVLAGVSSIAGQGVSRYVGIGWETRDCLRAPAGPEEVLVVNAHDFPPEGDDCDAQLVVRANSLGWRRFICHGYVGQRFLGAGLGPSSHDVVIDVYGSSGDYLASGLDGATVIVHGNVQDQVAQILKDGRLVVHGDVGQTFMYGAKGGSVFVRGNAAGRPLINAVGRPKAVINGTCLDFLAESFMAGDPLDGGGFVILNGIKFGNDGNMSDLDTPYSGSNLFSLASGGAIYVRDPHSLLDDEQLNGGEYVKLSDADWKLIHPYLQENERLFGIPVSGLLTVNGEHLTPEKVYRKVVPAGRNMCPAVADDDADESEE